MADSSRVGYKPMTEGEAAPNVFKAKRTQLQVIVWAMVMFVIFSLWTLIVMFLINHNVDEISNNQHYIEDAVYNNFFEPNSHPTQNAGGLLEKRQARFVESESGETSSSPPSSHHVHYNTYNDVRLVPDHN